jgi:hypothetical protein
MSHSRSVRQFKSSLQNLPFLTWLISEMDRFKS